MATWPVESGKPMSSLSGRKCGENNMLTRLGFAREASDAKKTDAKRNDPLYVGKDVMKVIIL